MWIFGKNNINRALLRNYKKTIFVLKVAYCEEFEEIMVICTIFWIGDWIFFQLGKKIDD